jgi:drug/metabolite transporter (DMT)-like permease
MVLMTTSPARRAHAPQAIVLANVATLCFGLAGALGTLSQLSAPDVAFGRVAFAAPALYGVVRMRRLALCAYNRRDLALLCVQGLTLALHWTTFFAAIAASSVATGVLAFSSFPLFSALLAPMVLHQRTTRLEAVAACMIPLGIWTLIPTFSLTDSSTRGVALGITSGALFAVLSVLNRRLGSTYPSAVIGLYQDGVAACTLLPVLLLQRPLPALSSRSLICLIILGLVCTAAAHTMLIESLRVLRAQVVSLIAAAEPVWAVLLAFLLLHERPDVRVFWGGAIIVIASILPAFGSREAAATSP